jgi:hypothetical protein
MQGVRRVVTGHDPSGRSVFVSDAVVPPITFSSSPDGGCLLLWSSDELPTFPADGIDPYDKGLARNFFPAGPGGYRFNMFSYPPESSGADMADLDPAAMMAEVNAKVPGILDHNDPDAPGMHATDTIDLEIVLTGELTLELDDGAEKVCRAGEVIIQNGTRHRWHNRGSEVAVIGCIMIGGTRTT